MPNRSANWVLTALLMLQLALGLQWQVAHAAAAPPEPQTGGMEAGGTEAGHCPGHRPKDSRSVDGGGAGASTSAASSHDNPANKHDCCRSVGCQCHYAQSPGVLDLPRTIAAFSALLLLPVFDAQLPVARTNRLFRPPIA
jgi:hypothetical protein